MRADHRILSACALLLAVACASKSEQGQSLLNGGFEQGSVGSAPNGWFVPQPVIDAGYSVRLSDSNPKEGKQCAAISGRGGNGFGNIMQAIDATAYRGKTIRFRAAVRFDSGGSFGRAQLWLRIDRVGSQ